jgi:hypothetical protein
MLLPLLLISLATLAAAVAVYGTLPQWVLYEHGLSIIEWTRRLQWPLFTLSLLFFLVLLVLIIARRHRAWWLIGFGPLLALFAQQFLTGSINAYKVLENPPCRPAAEAQLEGDEYVVGVRLGEQHYAYPYRYLYYAPVIVQSDRERRYVLIWSAFANRAVAAQVRGSFHARNLDIVSMPANSLLVYNARVGEFINGITGLTTDGGRPAGFTGSLPTAKMPWRQWRALHPATLVMELPQLKTQVVRPVLPHFPVPTSRPATRPGEAPRPELPLTTLVALIPSTQPIAFEQERLSPEPINFEHDGVPLLAFRDPQSGRLRVYDRRFQGLTSRFIRNYSSARAARHKVALLDVATNSGWTLDGLAVDAPAPIKGSRLRAVPVEESLYWGVMQYWYPELKLLR